MRDDMDELLKKTYHNGEIPANVLNQAIIQKVKEHENRTDKRVVNPGVMRGVKRMARVAAAFAAIVLVGSGVVYAATGYFSLEKFFGRYGGQELDVDTKNLIDNQPKVAVKEQKDSRDILNYKVQEVLCDSDYMVAAISVSVKDADKYFLVPDPYDIDSMVSSLSIGIDSDKSIEEYCQEHGLKPVSVDLSFAEQTVRDIVRDCFASDSGEITVMLGGERLTDDKEFTVDVKPIVFFQNDNESTYEDDTLQIHVRDSSKAQSAVYAPAEDKKNTPINIEEVNLKSTEVGTYLTVSYTGSSESEDASEMFIDLCDGSGNKIPDNIIGGGHCLQNEDGSYIYKGCYDNIELPDEIYLSLGDGKQIIKCEKK